VSAIGTVNEETTQPSEHKQKVAKQRTNNNNITSQQNAKT
jgi:hypothetical protein